MSSEAPQLYAELLPNIRQVTLYASLPHPHSEAPPNLEWSPEAINNSLSIRSSRRAVSFCYRGNAQSLDLPTAVANVQAPPGSTESGQDNRELTWRLQVDFTAQKVAGTNYTSGHDDSSASIPWTARYMCSKTKLRCVRCDNVFLGMSDGCNMLWKDLPSADWAEMMDLWHCHKPHEHKHGHAGDTNTNGRAVQDENETVKAYGAANKITCSSGTVLVDVSSFVLAKEDTMGLRKQEPSSTSPDQPSHTRSLGLPLQSNPCLVCSMCGAAAGDEQPSLQGLRLFKANLAVQRYAELAKEDQKDAWETCPAGMIVAAQLLELIERIGARRFVVHYHEDRTDFEGSNNGGMLVWVFNPDLRYSYSSSTRNITAQRAMKVFYQHVPNIQTLLNPEKGKPSIMTLEELCLPVGIYNAAVEALEQGNATLPASAKKFREWNVGLLDRFEGKKEA